MKVEVIQCWQSCLVPVTEAFYYADLLYPTLGVHTEFVPLRVEIRVYIYLKCSCHQMMKMATL